MELTEICGTVFAVIGLICALTLIVCFTVKSLLEIVPDILSDWEDIKEQRAKGKVVEQD